MNTLKNFKDNVAKIFNNDDLSTTEISALIAIELLADNEQGVCFASNNKLAGMLNVSSNRISHVISSLAAKGMISLQYEQKGKALNVNDKQYLTYRLIKPLVENNNTPIVKNNNTPLLKITTKSTKNKSTKNKSTNNLSTSNVDNKVNTKKKLQREIKTKHKKLFNYAMTLIQDRKSVGSKNAYALTIVINWLKAGLNTVEKVQEDKAKHHQVKSSKSVFVEKVPEYITKQPVVKPASQETLNDINRLKAKLNC